MCLINDDVLVLMLHTQRVEATWSMCLLCADIVESSAKISTMHSFNTSGRSLIYTKNSVGPSTEPWGTTETTLPQFKSVPDTNVCWMKTI